MPSAVDQAAQACSQGMFLRAEFLIGSIDESDESYERGQALLAGMAFQNGRPDVALSLLEPLERTEEVSFGLAAAYRATGNEDKAIECFLSTNTVHGQYAAAQALTSKERFEEALNILTELNQQLPNDVEILFALSNAERGLGLIDEAQAHLMQIIAIDSGYALAYVNLIGIASYERDMFDIQALERLANSVVVDKMTEALLRNALGKCYEAIGRYQDAFNEYSKANDYVRTQFDEDVTSQHKTLADRIEREFTREMVEAFRSDKECPLIFIFGMPRSGSTLVEQILINHPDIETDGETANVQVETAEWIKRIENGIGMESFPDQKDALGDEYLRMRVKGKSRFVIDKMPANYNYIGLMAMLFPNARFIYTKRNKADVCLSGWSTIYSHGHGYSYTLEEMSEEYDIHERIVNHWLDIMPEGSIHVVEYEKMVSDFDNEVDKLCAYLGVDRVPEMSEFHKLQRRVHTASVGQVTKPLYSTSVGRAARFGDLLEAFR